MLSSHKQHRIHHVCIVAFLLFTASLLTVRAGGDAAGDAPAANTTALETLQRLKWMHGEWVADHNGDTLEESWSAPSADSLMGVFRWIKRDGVWMFELITVTAGDDDVTFRLKHFNRNLIGWEEKDEALTATLTRVTDTEAVFDGQHGGKPLRFAYTRHGDELVAQIGKDEPIVLHFKRR